MGRGVFPQNRCTPLLARTPHVRADLPLVQVGCFRLGPIVKDRTREHPSSGGGGDPSKDTAQAHNLATTRLAVNGVASMLETRDLTIRFGGHVAVDAVSCSFSPGTLTAIVGPNGAGKTTYFNLISGQLRPTAGRVVFGGADITRMPASGRARKGLGRAFQLTNLFPHLSVR